MFEDGSSYEGERINGRAHGKGKLMLSNRKGVYEGDFVKGKREGYGIQTSHTIVLGGEGGDGRPD